MAQRQFRMNRGGGIVGFDMPAVLALAPAAGADPVLLGQFAARVESIAVSKLNERLASG